MFKVDDRVISSDNKYIVIAVRWNTIQVKALGKHNLDKYFHFDTWIRMEFFTMDDEYYRKLREEKINMIL